MPFGAKFKNLCQREVTYEPFASEASDLSRTYGAAVTLANTRLVRKQKVVRNSKGDEEVSSSRLYVVGDTVPSIDIRGRITLGDGSQPVMLAVETPDDKTGAASHAVVYFR